MPKGGTVDANRCFAPSNSPSSHVFPWLYDRNSRMIMGTAQDSYTGTLVILVAQTFQAGARSLTRENMASEESDVEGLLDPNGQEVTWLALEANIRHSSATIISHLPSEEGDNRKLANSSRPPRPCQVQTGG